MACSVKQGYGRIWVSLFILKRGNRSNIHEEAVPKILHSSALKDLMTRASCDSIWRFMGLNKYVQL